ncbi:MAG: DNA topoisomerase IB [Myxococcales bacterium]|nr:DNA topoisomerase IB [Myxococcales bacterium]MCB9553137.1 DNA topoisomerase IB [Myxococcales bacterium]
MNPSLALDDPAACAIAAGLRYVSDAVPGITRRRCGRGFAFFGPDGACIRDAATRRRLLALAVPPAWRQVWLCPHPDGHIQATGRDDRGRKQYRYHPRWQDVRAHLKYDRLIDFARGLPRLRQWIGRTLARGAFDADTVRAVAIYLVDQTLMRIGNTGYEGVGATTLEQRHLELRRTRARFRYTGKSGIEREVDIDDRRILRVLRKCVQIPGQHLFDWIDDAGERHRLDSHDVNRTLADHLGEGFTAKDFRTWGGTVVAADLLAAIEVPETEREREARLREAVDAAAERLGNTRAVCRRHYLHPAIIARWEAGALPDPPGTPVGLSRSERRALAALIAHRDAMMAGSDPIFTFAEEPIAPAA